MIETCHGTVILKPSGRFWAGRMGDPDSRVARFCDAAGIAGRQSTGNPGGPWPATLTRQKLALNVKWD